MNSLPNLAYVGDVSVEPTHAGSLLIWRLLQEWPQEKLRVIEFATTPRKTEERLLNTTTVRVPFSRFSRSRLRPYHSEVLTRSSPLFDKHLERLLFNSGSEQILTVVHGWSWIWAAEYAQKRGLPYHLIVHDDFPSFHPRISRDQFVSNSKLLRKYFLKADSVFCVSENMKVTYEREFDGNFDVLLPSRSREQKCESSATPNAPERDPQIVYAGSINSESVALSLRGFADQMEQNKLGRLVIYSQIENVQTLDHPRISLRGMVPPDRIPDVFKNDADLLLLLMSFDAASSRNMQMCFPSKLVDYTAAAKPILFWGPEQGSGITWGKSVIGSSFVSSSPNPKGVFDLMKRISTDVGLYKKIASELLEAGGRDFCFESTFEKFLESITKI